MRTQKLKNSALGIFMCIISFSYTGCAEHKASILELGDATGLYDVQTENHIAGSLEIELRHDDAYRIQSSELVSFNEDGSIALIRPLMRRRVGVWGRSLCFSKQIKFRRWYNFIVGGKTLQGRREASFEIYRTGARELRMNMIVAGELRVFRLVRSGGWR